MIAIAPAHPSAEVTIASRGISKGVAQTNGLQFVGRGQVSFGALQFSAQYKNITSPAARGQASAALGFAKKIRGFLLSAKASYKFRTELKPGAVDTEALELTVGASRRRGPFEARINYSYSPNDLGTTRRSGYLEATASLEVTRSTSLSATIGHRDRERSPDYSAFSFGVSRSISHMLSADLRYYDTDRTELGYSYSHHAVVSLRAKF